MSHELSEFQTDLDDAFSGALADVCAKHSRIPGPFVGIIRWYSPEGEGTALVYPEVQHSVESVGLSTVMDLLLKKTLLEQITKADD
jgi:hypothetical protein